MSYYCICSAADCQFIARASTVYDEISDKSRYIDSELKKEAIENLKILKILLLGSSNSGKSTVAKQMKILHANGFVESELVHYKYTIRSNFVDALGYMARGVRVLQIEVPAEEFELVKAFGESHHGKMPSPFDSTDCSCIVTLMRTFLEFSVVKQAYQSLNQFYVPDNTEYLLTNANRLLQSDYVPTNEDIIQARASTQGIYEVIFVFKKFTIRLIDVGGQKTERRKWIHCFEGVSAILFVMSLSCYNEVMQEDSKVNQLRDSVELCKEMWKSNFLQSSSFILFLNKKDVLARKLRHSPLQEHYPAFRDRISPNFSPDQVYDAAVAFIKHKFERHKTEKRPIYSHVTNATDTRNIDFVFNTTCEILTERNMSKTGIS